VLAYFRGAEPPALRAALAEIPGLVIGDAEVVPDEDWEREWRRGLEPRRVGPLWIRPSWCASPGTPELVIDPRQAFGSGEHASTRLALELLLEALEPGERVLDVGAGSGILLLGAMRLGGDGLGIDIDPVACANARDNARANGLRARFVAGGLDALAPDARFELVAANMLWSRLEPLLPAICDHAARAVILSGHLETECERVYARMGEGGYALDRERRELQSGDVWCASRWSHPRALQSSSSSSSIDSKE
jgi:ribosomal protein L11 methyltransferase